MLKPKYQYSIYLCTLSLWWGATLIADVLVAPAIFRIVENFFMAGDLAMLLFSRVNSLELVISTIAIAMLSLIHLRHRNHFILILGIFCWGLALCYFSYLIPKIISLTDLWKQAEKMGVIGIGDVPDVQQAHQYFHRIYVALDMAKFIILSFLLGHGVIKQDKLA